jgi:hypothetical protein
MSKEAKELAKEVPFNHWIFTSPGTMIGATPACSIPDGTSGSDNGLQHDSQPHSPLKTTVFNFVQLDLSYLITSVKPPQRTGEIYDNEITSLIDIYFLRISFIPSDLFRYFIYVTYSIDK